MVNIMLKFFRDMNKYYCSNEYDHIEFVLTLVGNSKIGLALHLEHTMSDFYQLLLTDMVVYLNKN